MLFEQIPNRPHILDFPESLQIKNISQLASQAFFKVYVSSASSIPVESASFDIVNQP